MGYFEKSIICYSIKVGIKSKYAFYIWNFNLHNTFTSLKYNVSINKEICSEILTIELFTVEILKVLEILINAAVVRN